MKAITIRPSAETTHRIRQIMVDRELNTASAAITLAVDKHTALTAQLAKDSARLATAQGALARVLTARRVVADAELELAQELKRAQAALDGIQR